MVTQQALVDLAYRIETAEAAASQARMEGRQAYRPSGNPFEAAQFGRTILLSAPRSRRDSYCNRALAFSTEDRERLDDILQWLRERDAYFIDLASVLVDGPLLQSLVDEGFHATAPSNVLLRRAEELDDPPPLGVEVREIDLEDLDQLKACSTVRNRGLNVPAVLAEAGQRTFRAEYAGLAWRIYLAYLLRCSKATPRWATVQGISFGLKVTRICTRSSSSGKMTRTSRSRMAEGLNPCTSSVELVALMFST